MVVAIVGFDLESEAKLRERLAEVGGRVVYLLAHEHKGGWDSFFTTADQIIICEEVGENLGVKDLLQNWSVLQKTLHFRYLPSNESSVSSGLTGLDNLRTFLVWKLS